MLIYLDSITILGRVGGADEASGVSEQRNQQGEVQDEDGGHERGLVDPAQGRQGRGVHQNRLVLSL